MNACILAGFAKKKKYVGGIYACNGSDLPATQDRGTSQVSGPYESTPILPATEVTYTIIGKTQCGDDIRRITTKTYSSRSASSQHKALWVGGTYINDLVNPITPVIIPQNAPAGYGTTVQEARTSWNTSFYNLQPISAEFYVGGQNKAVTKYTFIDSAYVRYQVVSDGTIVNALVHSDPSDTILTLYYLDVHEVWTYDLV